MRYKSRKKAILLLADGTIFHGKAIGKKEQRLVKYVLILE